MTFCVELGVASVTSDLTSVEGDVVVGMWDESSDFAAELMLFVNCDELVATGLLSSSVPPAPGFCCITSSGAFEDEAGSGTACDETTESTSLLAFKSAAPTSGFVSMQNPEERRRRN